MKAVTLRESVRARLLTGLTPEAAPAVAEKLMHDSGARVAIVLVRSMGEAERWSEDFCFYAQVAERERPPDCRLLPPEPGEDDPRAFELACDRLTALSELLRRQRGEGGPLVVATTPRALLQPVPAASTLSGREIVLRVGETHPFQQLAERLATELGYDHEAVCESPGQFAVRGGLIDVYPVNAERPLRIDFFGDEVEALRPYDPTTQLSEEKASEVRLTGIPPEGENPTASVLDYLPETGLAWLLHEPSLLAEDAREFFYVPEKAPSPRPTLHTLLEARAEQDDTWIGLGELDVTDPFFGEIYEREPHETARVDRGVVAPEALGADRAEAEAAARNTFLRDLKSAQDAGEAVYIVCRNEGEEERLREVIAEDSTLAGFAPSYLRGDLTSGFRLDQLARGETLDWPGARQARAVVLVSDAEIFGRGKRRITVGRRRKMPNRAQVDQALDFSELADGDALVHLQHGICLFRGLTKMEIGGREEEVFSLEFDEGITLHLPLHESHLLTRYVGLTKTRPKLGKLGGNQWEKTRRAAEKATLDFAAELLHRQARRQSVTGHAFGGDTPWQREFEESFPFRETPDQLTAIAEAKADMEREKPMDRLLCGDVGFGKTEVALRALFKCALEGKQAALLVPTTVLAQQHFHTCRERFADYPVVVEMLSRFRTPKQQKEVLKQLKEGRIDILVGTHRALSRDVVFKDLGLLVVDEEHRFGVRQKERIKALRETVDILSMSATPIPRTLYLALVGARDLSVIETAPVDRLPIQTIVKSYDPELVKNAIRAETERGGQVFYLHNRVQSIHAVAAKLNEMLPDLSIGVGHGQMEEKDLEKVMTDFVAGRYDVLVCTTIIESGLDIPNCNTLIIEGADRFGLAQLYQIRGRVGRFKRQAYAYLLLHKHARLLGHARERLSALRQYNQLGAGFRIAMRDLELRGAGNLLGSEQSGHVAGVGFDLYCQLLRQSIARLKDEPGADYVRATVKLDFVALLGGEASQEEVEGYAARQAPDSGNIGYDALKAAERGDEEAVPVIEAGIPLSYVGETRLRIDFYRRLAMAASEEEVAQVEAALKDRFGAYPESVQALLYLTRVRCAAEQHRLDRVEAKGSRLLLHRAGAGRDAFIKLGPRFPRLEERRPLLRLREILRFLHNRL